MSRLLRFPPLASRSVLVGLAVGIAAAASPLTSPQPGRGAADGTGESPPEMIATSGHRGHDRFDEICTLDDLRELEQEIINVVERVRSTVVLLRAEGGRGGAGSSGTAVLISKDGLLATCGHVGRVPGRRVTALLADGSELHGTTLGQVFEDEVDCGLVQLDVQGRELPAASLGTTAGLAAGDWVVAMGYTHGLRHDARPSLARVGRVLEVHEKALLFDAPIDAGDSGGPSFNLRGEVVGLNSRCGRESWQNAASPIDLLIDRMESLLAQTGAPLAPPVEQGPEGERGPEEPSLLPSDDVPAEPHGAVPGSTSGSAPRSWRFPVSGSDAEKRTLERAGPIEGVVAGALASMVQVHCNGLPVALGVIVHGSGLAVTKASQLTARGRITVETPSRAILTARIVGRDEATDVALLRFDARPRVGGDEMPFRSVVWAIDAPVLPGAVMLTPRGAGGNMALGFAAIEHRESELDALDRPFLGVQSRPATPEERERAAVPQAVTIVRVVPGAAAERAGLKPGDLIVAVGGRRIDSPDQLRNLLGRHRVGARLRIEVVTSDGPAELQIALGRRGDARGMRRGNTATPISHRSTGFGRVLAHDAVTTPEEMGGPVVDVEGRVVGMNIARFDRTATHALGADRMAELCERLVSRALRSRDLESGAASGARTSTQPRID